MTDELIEPSDAEQAEWPDTTFWYVNGLHAQIEALKADKDRLRALLKQTVHLACNYAKQPAGSIFENAIAEARQALADMESDDGR